MESHRCILVRFVLTFFSLDITSLQWICTTFNQSCRQIAWSYYVFNFSNTTRKRVLIARHEAGISALVQYLAASPWSNGKDVVMMTCKTLAWKRFPLS